MYYLFIYEDLLPDLYDSQTGLYTMFYRDEIIEDRESYVRLEQTADSYLIITKEEYDNFRENPWILQLY